MIETKQSLDIKADVASLKHLITHDGNYIVVDPDGGANSFPTKQAAQHEIRRLKATKRGEA